MIQPRLVILNHWELDSSTSDEAVTDEAAEERRPLHSIQCRSLNGSLYQKHTYTYVRAYITALPHYFQWFKTETLV